MNRDYMRATLVLVLICLCSSAQAYYETHPPYQFKQGPFRHVPDKPLLDKDIPLLIKKDNEQISDEILIFRK